MRKRISGERRLPACCRQLAGNIFAKQTSNQTKNVLANCRDEQAGSLCSPIQKRLRRWRIVDLNQEQRGIFEKVAEFFQIFRAERAVDDAVVAAHRDRHTMTGDDLVGVIDNWDFRDLADGEDETLRRIDNGGETVDAHAAEI